MMMDKDRLSGLRRVVTRAPGFTGRKNHESSSEVSVTDFLPLP